MACFMCQLTYLRTSLLVLYILSQETGTQAFIEGCSNQTANLGLANGTIPDDDITSSSALNTDSLPHYARLGNSKGWIPDGNHPWIQVNLRRAMNITAVATQGTVFKSSPEFIRSYYLSYGYDGNNWMNYTIQQGLTEVFPANVNAADVVKVVLNPFIVARYIRLHPTNCSDRCALRMELYGCISTAGLPGRPSSLRKTSVSTRSVNITWNAPADVGYGITGYNVRWQEAGASSTRQKVISNNTVATLDNLAPYTNYDIQVQAFNWKGESPWSLPLRVQSAESVPSVAPGNFKLNSSSSLSLDVSWDAIPQNQQQGKLLGYKILYKKEGSQIEVTRDVRPNTTISIIEGLEFANYSVKVAGYTAVGDGKFTDSLTLVPNEGAPSPPRDLALLVVSSTSIKVSWKVPQTTNGIIKRYVVSYGKDQPDNQMYTTSTTYELTPLEEYTQYSVKVVAETSVSGQPSNIVKATTLEDAPSSNPAIKKDGTKAEDAHTIRVEWQEIKQDDRNGNITGYTVFYNAVKGPSAQFGQNVTASETSTTIVGLKPFTEYCIKVVGYTRVGRSPLAETCYKVQTLQKGPSRPQNVRVTATSSVSIDVYWEKPASPNGVISEYVIYYGLNKNQLKPIATVTGSTFQRTLTGLRKFTTYYIEVRGKTVELGNASRLLKATTFEDRPGPPTQLHIQVVSGTDVLLLWKKPDNENGIIRKYLIKTYDTKTGREVNSLEFDMQKDGPTLSQLVEHLTPFTNYTFVIQAFTIEAGDKANTTAKTLEEVPGKPTKVTATLKDGDIEVAWEEPVDPNGIITGYKIYCKGKRDYSHSFQINLEIPTSKSSRYLELKKTDLAPGTKFTVYITAFTSKGEGAESDHRVVNTPAVAPPPPTEPQVHVDSVTSTTINITLTPSSDSNGKVIFHQVIVEKLGKVNKREIRDFREVIVGYEEAKRKDEKFYIAAMFSREELNRPTVFVLGDGEKYGDYINAPLDPGTKYKLYIRAVTDVNGKWLYGKAVASPLPPTARGDSVDGSNKGDGTDKAVGIIAGILGVLVLVAIVIVAILLYKRSNRGRNPNLDVENQKRRRREFAFKRLSSKKKVLAVPGEVINDADHPPVSVEQFAKHVAKLHKSDDRGYMVEYNKLDSGQEYEANAALLPENRAKNRYANIIAYDHSRVALTSIDGILGSDYINASRIDGYNKPNAYIATQGPVPPTFDDFWRMVWEKQSSTVIMLTNLQERHKLKCHKYWPDETQEYGDISVMLVKSEHYSDYIIRTFNVKKESEKEEREVKQFHFTVWPDHGVPEYPTALLAFRRRVRAYNPVDAGPMIVHCSAGVGRTGTFMVIDSTLDRIKAENTVDIFNYVAYLRTRRTAMVQTEEQYTFCHDGILEAVQCGNTQIYAHDLRITLARMDEVSKDKLSRFETEFKTLNKVSPALNKGCYFVASYPENKEKNRCQDILAPDFSRVALTAIDDSEPTSYINAVHIPGYKQQHAFIVTHYPLTPTVTDFWRMLCEQECSCVVLFDSSEEDGDFPLFWPEDESTYEDMITVQRLSASSSSVDNLKANYDQAEINEKTFKATDLRTPEKSLRIKFFQYSGWTEEDKIPPCSGLITLMAKVEKWQQHSGNGPITVVCSDGLSRSGTFCALYSVLERLKIEQVVDVFQAVKAMRIPRPGLVRTAAEYRFIHFAVQEYLSAFDDYANFKP